MSEGNIEMSDEEKDDEKTVKGVRSNIQVVNAAGVAVSNNPVGGQRHWIKLWCAPWLEGTTRYMNTGSERAFWVDLLAEAGRGRFPGFICPGQECGELIGYPLAWYQAKQPDIDVMATLEKFANQDKIAFEITCKNPVCIVVEILNWKKYQAPMDDAERSRAYRKNKKKG